MEEGNGKKEKGIDRRERDIGIDVVRGSYNYSVIEVYMIEVVMVVVRFENGQTTITSTSEWLIKMCLYTRHAGHRATAGA